MPSPMYRPYFNGSRMVMRPFHAQKKKPEQGGTVAPKPATMMVETPVARPEPKVDKKVLRQRLAADLQRELGH